jgi:hypothetical protein
MEVPAMRKLRSALAATAMLCLLTSVHPAMAATGRSGAGGGTCTGSWTVGPSPMANRDNALTSVAAISASDAWAVGWNIDQGGRYQTLAEHWDGTVWTRARTPGAPDGSFLQSVSAVSTDNVWAAGYQVGHNGLLRTLIEHRDGTAWSPVHTPNGRTDNVLNGIAMDSANDGWAVGDRSGDRHLLLHWDGISWKVMAFRELGTAGTLRAVAATSPTNAWIVGTKLGHSERLQAWHWDGSRWNAVAVVPSKGSFDAVTTTGPQDAWAAVTDVADATVERWGPTPSLRSIRRADGPFLGVAAASSTDVWAVGPKDSAHWDGSSWHEVPIVDMVEVGQWLGAAAVAPTGEAFAVGFFDDDETDIRQALVEMYC